MKNYYVYILLNPLKPGNYIYCNYQFNYEPFYIGKGQGKRIFYHSSKNKKVKNKLKNNILLKIKENSLKTIRLKIKENLSEIEAFKLEKELIKTIGLRISGNGPLSNMTNGGEGISGYKHTVDTKKIISEKAKGKIISEAQRKAISNANKGRKLSKETCLKISKGNRGKIISEAQRKAISNANKGRNVPEELREYYSKKFKGEGNPFYGKIHTDDAKKKISESNKGRTPHNIGQRKVGQYSLDDKLIKIWDNLNELVEITGYPKSNICRSIYKSLTCKGYKWKYIDNE